MKRIKEKIRRGAIVIADGDVGEGVGVLGGELIEEGIHRTQGLKYYH